MPCLYPVLMCMSQAASTLATMSPKTATSRRRQCGQGFTGHFMTEIVIENIL